VILFNIRENSSEIINRPYLLESFYEVIKMIDSYSFGQIVIEGKIFNSDVIIYQDSVDQKWWRKEGHLLQKEDLLDVIKHKPEIIIIGTGKPGLMEVPDETKQFVQSKGIKLIVNDTENACKIYNKLERKNKVIAALHLTC
jgi:hypothetical protein